MSFLRFPSFGRGKGRDDTTPNDVLDARPTLRLHVPTFGGIVMKPLLNLVDGAAHEPTILAGQAEIELASEHDVLCSGISVWLEARWTDVEGLKDKGSSVCFEQRADVDCPDSGEIRLRPGRQRYRFKMTLPPTLPRNGRTPIGRLMYWLVGTVDGLPDQCYSPASHPAVNRSTNTPIMPASSSTASASQVSTLPSYDESRRDPTDVKWLRGSVRSERRIAVSHNPNQEGGVSRLDDDFSHNILEFGTCRIQVRVNEWCVGCLFPIRLTCLALSPLATLFAIRVKLVATTTITPPSTGRSTITKEAFTIVDHGLIPQPLSLHPRADAPALWRGIQAGGDSSGDLVTDLSGKLPTCEYLQPTTLPDTQMPRVELPLRCSHKLVYEVFFSVFGMTGSGKPMPSPGQGGIQLMRRSVDVVLPQCVFVSEVLNLPSYSTVFGENIRRTDEYFYHRIEANLPCHTCHIIPLHNLCTTCPADIAVHVQHSMPLSQAFSGRDSKGKAEGDPSIKFDPTSESCPTCSGKSVLPGEDPKYHLCGCEIEGREAAYHVVWDEIRPNIVKEVTS